MCTPEMVVRGRVSDQASSEGLSGLRVVGVTTEGSVVALLLSGTTGEDGVVEFALRERDVAAVYGSATLADAIDDIQPIHFSVFNGDALVDAVQLNVALRDLTLGELANDIRIDRSSFTPATFRIYGRVVDGDGVPQTGVTVDIFHVEVGTRTRIATGTVSSTGEYDLTYPGVAGSVPERPGLPLQVVVMSGATEIARSPVINEPTGDERADVVVETEYRGRGEYDRVAEALTAQLGATTLSALTEDDLEILAHRADVFPPHAALAIQAARLADGTTVDESTFYALLRARLPTSKAGVLSMPRDARQAALRAAYRDRILAPPTSGSQDAAIAAAMVELDALAVEAAMVAPGVGETNVRALLDTTGLDQAQLEAFATHWVAHAEDEKSLWDAVETDAALTGTPATLLRFTVDGAALVRGFLPALTELHAQRTAASITTLQDLAAWDIPEWTTFVATTGSPDDLPGDTPAERDALYAATLNRLVESQYPTSVLGHRIARDTPASTTGVSEFIDANANFDVKSDVIAVYLEANPGSIPGGQDPVATAANLETVQRLYSLTPPMHNYDVTRVLLDNSVTSALDIVQLGRGTFNTTFAPLLATAHPSFTGAELADRIFAAAQVKHAATTALTAMYGASLNTLHATAIPANLAAATGDGTQTLLDIFGSLDYCACEHCRSVFGPAAYLVDLLVLLGAVEALDELNGRRDDIRALELSCINTNTALPYIDLVNELLEDLVSGGPVVARNTTWSAEELRLFPEYRNLAAYDDAATAVYPWALPLHVPTVELRGYLERLGVPRVELMRKLQAGGVPAPIDVAAEALGMTPFEASVVVGAEPADLAQPWNLGGDATFGSTLAADLPRLLDAAGLQLDELLEVLALPWVVPGAAVGLQYPGGEPTCDLDEITLSNFGNDEAERLHRLLRLSRTTGLGWTELESAIRKLGGAPEGHALWASGLVLHPNLETLSDPESGSTGTATGTVVVSGENARDFEASSNDRISWAPAVTLTDTPLSIAMWVNEESLAADQYLFEFRSSGAALAGGIRIESSNQITFFLDRDTTELSRASNVLGASLVGVWHHVCVTYDGSQTAGGVSIYLDGVELTYASTTDGSGAFRALDQEWTIGGRFGGSDGFDGLIRDVRVWDRALPAADVVGVHEGLPDLRAFFDQWRASGTSVPTSGLVFAPDLATLDDPQSGLSGNASSVGYDEYHRALVTQGNASSCSWPSVADFTGAPFSFACWVRPDVIGASDIFFSIDGSASSDAYQFRFSNAAGSISFLHVRAGGTHTLRASTETIAVGEWAHIAVIHDGTSNGSGIRLFINGAETAYSTTQDGSGGTPRVPDGDWYLGNTSVGTQGLSGRIRAAHVWDRELTSSEIQGLFGADPEAPADLDAEFLGWLADAQRVRERLGLTMTQVAALWSPIETWSPPDGLSPYDRMFLPRSLAANPTASFDLNGDRTELASTPLLDADAHHDTIRAALSINDTDLQTLLALALPDSVLNLANLSELHRHVLLARGLGMTISELQQLLGLATDRPFSSPQAALAFIDMVDALRSTGMPTAEIDYVCRHVFDPAAGIDLTDATASDVVLGILADVEAVDDALAATTGDDLAQTLAHLQALLSAPADVDRWMQILGSPSLEPTQDQPYLEDTLETLGVDAATIAQFIADLNTTLGPGTPGYSVAAPVLLAARRRIEIDALVVQALSEAVNLAPEPVTILATNAAVLAIGGATVRDLVTDGALLVGGEPGPQQIEALVRMHKAARLVTGLELSTDDLAWYFVVGGAPQAMDLTALPVAAVADGAALFAQWQALRLGQELQAEFSSADNAIRTAVAQADLVAAIDLLIANSTWDAADVAFVTGTNYLDLDSQADLRDPSVVAKIREVVQLVRRSGVRAADLAVWAQQVPTGDMASAGRRALKARHSESSWPDVIRPMTDEMRERQRDALVALLINAGTYSDEMAIYRDLLIDTQMNACALTSRIKLAVSSVQLLIQRALMGLESGITIPEHNPPVSSSVIRQWWPWMKNYRLWEANRLVFFYPENWAEPDLRDDKTPLFKELESQLDQGSMAKDEIEQAFAQYLYGLHEIAQLDVVAVFDEKSTVVNDVVHVVGRTRSEPKKHFYRSRIEDTYWTPWVPIELEINSDNVVLAAHNRRLFLLWVVAIEAPDEGNLDSPSPAKYRFKLFWSERRGQEWTAARSTEVTEDPASVGVIWRTHVVVGAGDDLVIEITEWQLTPGEAKVHARFEYDDCLDLMVETDVSPSDYPETAFGVVPERWVRRQQQIGPNSPSEFRLVFDMPPSQNPIFLADWLRPLVYGPGAYRATLVTEGYRPFSPCVFDNTDHSVYVVPVFTGFSVPEPQGISSGWNHFTLVSALPPAPVPPAPAQSPALAAVDGLSAPTPWQGSSPGTAALVVDGELISQSETAAIDTVAMLATSQAVVASDSTLSLGSDPTSLGGGAAFSFTGYRLDPFHHPYTCKLRSELNRFGVDGVLASRDPDLRRQVATDVGFLEPGSAPDADGTPILSQYIDPPYPVDNFDFSPGGAYSVYNWEMFFHVPLYIAERLRGEQRFEEAQRWYHYIFNPVALEGGSDPERFWNIKPFHEEADEGLPDVIQSIFQSDGLNAETTVLENFLQSVVVWMQDPFNPHRIARWRKGTYRWVVLRKYVDNLLDWADSLFRRDTIESINEATQLYVLAAEILGERPRQSPEVTPAVTSYDGLTEPILFGGLATMENYLTPIPNSSGLVGVSHTDVLLGENGVLPPPLPPPPPMWWYFCVPPNDQLLELWDRVADRLFKIRNCQNIDGVARQLALFEPPIDPALIIKAKAAGLDLGEVIASLQAPLPQHRYRVLIRQALDVCTDVRGLGAALLQALERKDVEALQELRATHEVNLLESIRQTRETQIKEAEASIQTIVANKAMAKAREDYYLSRKRRSRKEESHLKRLRIAMGLDIGARSTKLLASVLRLSIPTLLIGTANAKEIGGSILGEVEKLVGDSLGLAAFIVRETAGMQQTHAGYDRRLDDWRFQGEQGQLEQAMLAKQEAAATIRLDVATKELESHTLQIEQAQTVRQFLDSRYTSQELYRWLEGEIAHLYFQAYKLAFELAKKAERALQLEFDVDDVFVQYGHWDGLHKGLLAGERLQLDLRRMDAAYLELDRRELELTKRVSLRQLDPQALHDLRRDGECQFVVPEVLFDLDHPGHYRRRIKSVSLTIPAVVGPHTTLGAKLTMLTDAIRLNTDTGAGYVAADPIFSDTRFRVGAGGNGSIATSTARADAGVFNLDFRDDKLLPFEGAGAISGWRVELPAAVRQFDYDTISDVELEIRYTARDGGDSFRTTAENQLQAALNTALADTAQAGMLSMMLSAREAFPVAWERFLYPAAGQSAGSIELPIVTERFPHAMRQAGAIGVTNVQVIWRTRGDATGALSGIGTADSSLASPGAPTSGVAFSQDVQDDELVSAGFGFAGQAVGDTPWSLDPGTLAVTDPELVEDLIVLVDFTLT